MKVSLGFISNSSSSSFVIYGACFDDETVQNFASTFLSPEKYENISKDMCSIAESVSDHLGISFQLAYEEDCPYYFGEHPMSIGDNETGKEFKERVQNALRTIDENVKCECHEVETYS